MVRSRNVPRCLARVAQAIDDPLHAPHTELVNRLVEVDIAEVDTELSAQIREHALGAHPFDQLGLSPTGVRLAVADHKPNSLEKEQIAIVAPEPARSGPYVADKPRGARGTACNQEHRLRVMGGERAPGLG